jgi:disulfide oxidoreductase YuzD
MKIMILGGIAESECEVACGEDWCSQEAITLASERIKERFGEDISLEYVDLSDDFAEKNTREWKEMIKSRDLSLPLLLLNGELRISGQFDIRQLLDVIEVEREVGNYNGGKK